MACDRDSRFIYPSLASQLRVRGLDHCTATLIGSCYMQALMMSSSEMRNLNVARWTHIIIKTCML